ncbi:MAG: MBOAT family protein, partial [Candidatus Methylophosphatis roskildensis]
MLFNSAEYLLAFLPLSFFLYFQLTRRKLLLAGRAFLVLASLFFYGWWNPANLWLILFSII